MHLRIRMRTGVYWDEHNVERPCAILEAGTRRLAVLDARTGEPIPDPPSAIPVAREQPDE